MSGIPILLVHGFAQTPKSWQTVSDLIGDRHETHAIELPGHGATALGRGRPTVESARAIALEALDRNDLRRAAVWGYSQGARAALDLALNHPDRVAALVMESGAAGIEDPVARAHRRSRDAALASRIEHSTIEQFADLWERIPALTGQSRALIERQRPDRLAHDPIALAAALRGIGQASYAPMWNRLADLTIPVLAISGERDALYTKHAKRIAAEASGRHVTVAGAGHAVHLEQPEASVTAVLKFLSGS